MSSSLSEVGRDLETGKLFVRRRVTRGGEQQEWGKEVPVKAALAGLSSLSPRSWKAGAGGSCDLFFCILGALWPLGRGRIEEGQSGQESSWGSSAPGGGTAIGTCAQKHMPGVRVIARWERRSQASRVLGAPHSNPSSALPCPSAQKMALRGQSAVFSKDRGIASYRLH